MKRFLRWAAKILGSSLAAVLVIVLFPYVSRFVAQIMPDESGAAIKASAILSSKLENSARLETLRVTEEGVINYDIKAAFVGTVASINVSYSYNGSFGVDLSKVQMKVNAGTITFYLPEPELIQDDLVPNELYKDDFWYPGFSETDYISLLEREKEERRNVYLGGEKKELLWQHTVDAFDKTLSSWLKDVHNEIQLVYLPAEDRATAD